MLNQPINVIPSVLSGVGEGVIDATKPLVVSWQVTGDTPMVAYRVVIQQNTAESAQMFSTGKVSITPFYPKDYKGNQQTYSLQIMASQLASSNIVNGYANGYKIVITQWWGGATPAESITQTSPSVFITRAKPTVSINSISPSPYNKKNISITGTYSQSDGDSIALTRWILLDTSNPSEPLVDTGDMETQELQLDYDGLFNGGTYSVQLIIQTSSGVVAQTSPVTFSVSYPVSDEFGAVTACKPNGKGYVELSWESRSTIDPEETGTPTVEDGQLILGSGDSVTYSPTPIATPWSMVWRGSVSALDGNTHNVVQMSDGTHDYVLSITSASATFSYNGNIIFTKTFPVQYPVRDSDTLVIAITPTAYHIKQITITGGLLPLNTLYPSNPFRAVPTRMDARFGLRTVPGFLSASRAPSRFCEFSRRFRRMIPPAPRIFAVASESTSGCENKNLHCVHIFCRLLLTYSLTNAAKPAILKLGSRCFIHLYTTKHLAKLQRCSHAKL